MRQEFSSKTSKNLHLVKISRFMVIRASVLLEQAILLDIYITVTYYKTSNLFIQERVFSTVYATLYIAMHFAELK